MPVPAVPDDGRASSAAGAGPGPGGGEAAAGERGDQVVVAAFGLARACLGGGEVAGEFAGLAPAVSVRVASSSPRRAWASWRTSVACCSAAPT
ncbi:hypothetical protein [Krasilnikovia sp. MM14-A1259]|uniref:hypothetical protein n=1 Tax=Krasilnikovia sp. MM14-A1259 TaxID=3373539 RepID=UPI00399C7902